LRFWRVELLESSSVVEYRIPVQSQIEVSVLPGVTLVVFDTSAERSED
jgi:hypothetical protein